MGKEVELHHLFQTSFDNAVLLSEQKEEDGITLLGLITSLRNIYRHNGNCYCHISVDKEFGMILTIKSERDGKFHTFALNPPRSSETSE